MRFHILTLFPELFEPFSSLGLVGRAVREGNLQIESTHLREFAINAQGQIDDTPYGGGSGMVLRADAAKKALDYAREKNPRAKVVLLSPRGEVFQAEHAKSLVSEAEENDSGVVFLCCRYEGVDERIAQEYVDYQFSIGDYVLMGGEVAAMAIIESMARFVPGVLGNPESHADDSFEKGLLEYPQYTKPQEFEGKEVPDVLLSGNHQAVASWRAEQSLRDTAIRRPELLRAAEMPSAEISIALIHHPVRDKNGETITSSITNLDLHDIARSARTYGLSRFYAVHPTKTLRRLAERISLHWSEGYGLKYNPNRSDALERLSIVPDLDDVILDIETRTGKLPRIVSTSARESEKALSFEQLSGEIYRSDSPLLILLGTAWGLSEELLERADFHLAPICGKSNYNHLSVRSAAAIILDRLFGRR